MGTVVSGHHTETSQWLPPESEWNDNKSLPYGWEEAVDAKGKQYYINHVTKDTTPDDPREDEEDDYEVPEPREVELKRDAQMGFGFVAGSERPVVVRFVTEDGPSDGSLLPGDQIFEINREDVQTVPRERVIELVRSCKESIVVKVCQPRADNSSRKSALLTAAKKARLKNNPSRVRFADSVLVNGSPVTNPTSNESLVPFMPNVLKVFLENGQTKSFKYDSTTVVRDVLDALQEKLALSSMKHFTLVLLNVKTPTHRSMAYLHPDDLLAEVAARPGSQHFKCLLRVAFVPKDAFDLLQSDAMAFDYYYMQCCNDVVQERFSPELKFDFTLRLAALHILQYLAASGSNSNKISLKNIERECGLDRFLPDALIETTRAKHLRKMLHHYLKVHQNLCPSGSKRPSEFTLKLHYIKTLAELRSFGGKCFVATMVEMRKEAMVVVGPTVGISIITDMKIHTLNPLAEFDDILSVEVTKESEKMDQVKLSIRSTEPVVVTFSMLSDDVHDFVALIEGYYHLYVDPNKSPVKVDDSKNNNEEIEVPPYDGEHTVVTSSWSYSQSEQPEEDDELKKVDLAQGPPSYQESLHPSQQQVTPDITQKDELFLEAKGLTAPLASPDVSTISGSSDSSFTPPETTESVPENTDAKLDEPSTEAKDDDDNMMPAYEASKKRSRVADTRFGVTDFKTFSPHKEDDSHSETDTESAVSVIEAEKQPLISQSHVVHSESEDTDDLSTPSDSPAKRRLGSVFATDLEDPQSFGLHSPDQIPKELQKIASSFGLADSDSVAMSTVEGHARELKTGKFCEGALYLDPDIIDLTLIPPPKTPDADPLIDFGSEMALPPPAFIDPSPCTSTEMTAIEADEMLPIPDLVVDLPTPIKERLDQMVYNDEDLGTQLSAIDALLLREKSRLTREDEEDSGNETISSENVDVSNFHEVIREDEINTQDIDAFIATMTVPPPPANHDTPKDAALIEDSWKQLLKNHGLSNDMPHDLLLEEEFAKLVIPPPPMSSDLGEIPIVPSLKDFEKRGQDDINLKACSRLIPQKSSVSADSSPIHRVAELYAHSRVHNVMGTLPRNLSRRKRPPAPPPRRSSIPVQNELLVSDHSPVDPVPCVESLIVQYSSCPSTPQEQSPTFDISIPNNSSKFSTLKSKIKAYVSPSISRKQYAFLNSSPKPLRKLSDIELRKSDFMATAPAKIGRSNTFTARPFSSPQSSPLVSRHASFNTAGDHSPRTFRTFLGDRESRKRTSLSSSSCSSTSSQSPSSTIDLSAIRAELKPIPAKQTQEPATKTSESDNETSSVMPRKVSRRSTAPEHHRRSRSLDGQEVKPPPWRSRTPGGVSTFKKDSGISNGLSYPDYIRSKCYQGESAISDANADVIELIKMLSKTLDSFSSPAKLTNTDSGIFQKNKDALVAESRQFVTDSKMLVSSATHSKEKLVQNVNNSIHTLATLTHLCQITMATMTSLPLAIALGSKVKDVANAYKTTVNAAHNAAGMPLSDPNMKMLMRQATALAAVLSTFMKTLKTLDFTP